MTVKKESKKQPIKKRATKPKKKGSGQKPSPEEKVIKEYEKAKKQELEEMSSAEMHPVLPEPKTIMLLPDADHLMKLASTFAKSALFPGVTTEFEAAAIIEYGRELKMLPLTALQTIFPIPSKRGTRLCISSDALLAMAQRNGIKVEVLRRDAKGCKIKFSRKGQADHTEEFTEEDAKRADLLGKDNWLKYPKSMYPKRCISNGLRIFDPGIFLGLPTQEEMEDLEQSPLTKEADVKIVSQEPEKPKVTFTKSKDQPVEKGDQEEEVIDAEVVVEKKEEEEKPASPETEKEMVVNDIKEYLHMGGIDEKLFKVFLAEEIQPKKPDREFVGMKFGNYSFSEGKLEDLKMLMLHIQWAVDQYLESETFKKQAQDDEPPEESEEPEKPF